ncbi:T9SS type A sorting domain-containing protein [Flavobacterium aquidurense]|uniref:Secreted protein with Por secretion system C-terminal sorting domain n=1 Tax=Flavobacterium aquidurense TaxID=362413 RepID=A0A0Q0VTH5_9FLAO|nr:T9SS type A sorting domain-containing protein [Flavobacterium aquidurense]KQB37161.1 Secreted protein with Por secretion system C-terminal sorting domain [Flavobacterium aquidurense]
MKRNQQTLLILFITCISFITNTYAQQTVVVSGGNATGAGGSSSYSIGQTVYTSLTGATEYILQGIQQPYEIATLGNDEFTGINLVMSAYPNPTTDILNLVVVNDKLNDLSYNLFDINGKIISGNSKITSSETSISMQKLNQGIYFLAINDHNKTIKTFKIIKK